MTKPQAIEIVKNHRKETFYSVSPLQVGEVEIIFTFEDGFLFKRKTEYVKTLGIYREHYKTDKTFDTQAYDIAEVTITRYK